VISALTIWRLLELETHNAFLNMAIDESVLQARMDNLVPNTVRFYRWNPSAVSIGRFQDIEKEVQLENCGKNGVDVVRRITGGGTVYHSSADEITYSVIVKKDDLATEDINEVYRKIYSGLMQGIQALGLQANFDQGTERACPNLTISGRKISGSAQAHRRGVVLQHGTLLLKVDLEKMFTFLRVPWAQTSTQVVNVAKKKITSLKGEIGRETTIDDVSEALIAGFEKTFEVRLETGHLTPFESDLSERLCRKKYGNSDWNRLGKFRL
jgi:lipoate-protein ligase A